MTETPKKKLSHVEDVKRESHGLRGAILAELSDNNPYVSEDSYDLLKFHGMYQGYDRDSATDRKQQGLDKEYEFMVRLKMPGGRLKADQYLALDSLCDVFANGTLRITTRETFQFHCVEKRDVKPFLNAINKMLLSTLGGCGDVVRNIMTCPAPIKDTVHATLEEATYTLAKQLAPRTSGYAEIWLDGERVDYPFAPEPTEHDHEPLYGDSYMPRKFKIAIAQPEDNCVDALTNDLALLALFNGQELVGYNVAVGGGLGMTHNNAKTYPRLASVVGFVKPQDMLKISEAVVKLQRDHGDRGDRKHARLKYVVEEQGIQWTQETLARYFGRALDAPLHMPTFHIEEHTGWHEQGDGKWFLGVPISSGRIIDREAERIRSGLRTVIAQYRMNLVLTGDQNLILCDIEPGEKPAIEAILREHGIKLREDITPVYRNLLACVALPTCGKALAEAERVKLPLVGDIEGVMARHGLIDERIAIRIAGCPNGCSRPYAGEIGIVGRMPGHYALFLGGDYEGTRLSEKVFDRIPFEYLPAALEPLFVRFRDEREHGEAFGEFCQRVGTKALKDTVVSAVANTAKWG